MTKRTYYEVVHPSGCFSSVRAKNLKKAKIELEKWGECPNGTPENKAYWKKQQALLKIEKVIEIRKVVK
jgi:hypothetical protein